MFKVNMHSIKDEPKSRPPYENQRKVYESRHLLGEDKEIFIRHAGEIYRLRMTRQNKLILTK